MRRAFVLSFLTAAVPLAACVSALPGSTLGENGGAGGSSAGETTGGATGSGVAGAKGGAGAGGAGVAGVSGVAATGGFAGVGLVAGGGSAGPGAGGVGAPFICANIQSLECGGGALMLKDGHVTNFSPPEWNPIAGQYCDASGLSGSIFSYSGPAGGMSSNGQSVDAGTLRLTLIAGPGGYAGGGISFHGCVNASAFSALRFTAWLAAGDLTGCSFTALLQTFEQRPTTLAPPGGCDTGAASCYQFPASPSLLLAPMPGPIVVPFTDFTTSTAQARPAPSQLVGLQWQIVSGSPVVDGGPQPTCTVEIRIDDIDFI